MLALQVAIGIWFGGVLLVVTGTGFFAIKDYTEKRAHRRALGL